MRTTLAVTYAQRDQPDIAAWSAVVALAGALRPLTRVVEVPGLLWKVLVDDEASPAGERWRALHERAVAEAGVVALVSRQHHFERVELEDAPLAWVSGVGLDGLSGGPFVRNGAAAFAAVRPCPECGAAGPWSRPQQADLVVDERLLDRPVDGVEPPPGGWRLVNLEGGELAMAPEVAAAVLSGGRSGLVTRPLLAADTGRPSGRVVQVVAEVALPVPCLEHTALDPGTRICGCGTVFGHAIRAPMPTFNVRALGGRAAFSRDRLRSALLTLDRERRRLLAAACAPQLPHLGLPAQTCDHPTNGAGPGGDERPDDYCGPTRG
jgi:hypothetical protein